MEKLIVENLLSKEDFMLLVLILSGFIGLCILFSLIVLFSSIVIEVKQFTFQNYDEKGIFAKPIKQYHIEIKFSLFHKWNIGKLIINEEKVRKWHLKEKLTKVDRKALAEKLPSKKEMLKQVKRINLELEEFILQMNIGTENAILTSGIVYLLGSILSILFAKTIKRIYRQETPIQNYTSLHEPQFI